MKKLTTILFAASALIFSVATLIFALRFTTPTAGAVSSHLRGMPSGGVVFTQSKDGKVLYQWTYSLKAKSWKRKANYNAWPLRHHNSKFRKTPDF